MLKIIFDAKNFENYLFKCCKDYIYFYPAQAKRGLVGGLGVTNLEMKKCLYSSKGIFKFYNFKSCIPFLFLDETIYFKRLFKMFGLAPFIISNDGLTYYTNATDEEIKHLEKLNYEFRVEGGYCEYYDKNLNSLNPFLQLVILLHDDEIKRNYITTAVKWDSQLNGSI